LSSSAATLSDQDLANPALQIAPAEDSLPDFTALKKGFDACISDSQAYIDQCAQNYETRFALWAGQSADGKKHGRGEGGKTDPTPWDGASDLRVYLVDEAINSKVAMLCMAFRKANLVATPIEGNDLKRAKVVTSFMRWLIQTQIPEIDREVELLAQYIQEKGVAATGQFWETTEEKTLTTITIADAQEKAPNMDVAVIISDPMMQADMEAIFEEFYGCSKRKAKKMLSELRMTGTTTVAQVGKERSRPIVRTFNLDQNLFIPAFTGDLEKAPAIYRIEYYTPEQLRGLAYSGSGYAGHWDAEWVESAIANCMGKSVSLVDNGTTQTHTRSFVTTEPKLDNLVGAVFAYQRLSDEDGCSGIYCTVFNPHLPPSDKHDGYAKHGLLGYAHGEYPFTLHRREFLSRRLHDSRGLPEPGKPIQDQIKCHKDSRVDAASLAILPPMGYPQGRPPGKWGAGARIPERRQGEYHFMDRPMPDMITEASEKDLRADFNQYNGFVSPETDPQFSALKNQQEVNKFLSGWAKSYRQIWKLYQQFGNPEVYFRVIGQKQEDPQLFNKGDINEEYDVTLTWDVQSLNWDIQEKKFEALAKVMATFDKYGQADYAEAFQIAVESIDPSWAERIVTPQSVGAQKAQKDMQDTIVKASAGFDQDIQLGTPPQIGMQVIQQFIQAPDVQQRLMQDEPFKKRIQKLAKQLQFQTTQQENAKIGRYGA
jgi:hypothetical protein